MRHDDDPAAADPAPRRTQAGRWFMPVGVITCIGMLFLSGFVAVRARDHAWQATMQASDNLTATLERGVSSTATEHDLSLKRVITNLTTVGLKQANPQLRQVALFDGLAASGHPDTVLVLDTAGNIRFDSHGWPPRSANFADRDYFQLQRQHPDVGLFISRVVADRFTGRPELMLSRRISRPNGGFAGVVVETMETAYFQELFEHLNVGQHGSISLVGSEGHIAVRQPFAARDIDLDISGTSDFTQIRHTTGGSLVGNAVADGVKRLFTYRHVDEFPLILVVGVAVEDIFAPWRTEVFGITAALLVLSSVTMTLSLLVRRELRLRSAVEQKLAGSARTLAAMAQTDGLTGLANRRWFDSVLDSEWRRARRDGTEVSLLMLDVDLFKCFNDEYGHQAGDAALQAVATCIGYSAIRPGDLGARYGGEEFAVILPNTGREGAELIGERLREAVAKRSLPHPRSPAHVLTISVGVATMNPCRASTELSAKLLRKAGQALHEAKKRGRNRIEVSQAAERAIAAAPAAQPVP